MDLLQSEEEYTQDTLFPDELFCRQPRQGYRFSVDSVLLAHFVSPLPADRILELGAGCGVVSLVLAYRWPNVTIQAIEIQARLAALARSNVELNRFSGRITIIEDDFRRIGELVDAGSVDLVLCNPPYRSPDRGRLSAGEEKTIARHEVKCDLAAVISAMDYAVRDGGSAVFVYPAAKAAVLLGEMPQNGFSPKRMQTVYAYPGAEGKLVLLEAVKKRGGEELSILPPLYIYQEPGGAYSGEMARCYQPSVQRGS